MCVSRSSSRVRKSWVLSVNFPRQNACSMWCRLLTAAVVVCACLWFAPQQASASCGDYVMVEGHSGHHRDRDAGYSTQHQGKPAGTPVCNGPGCRQRREAPVSPTSRVTVDEHSWGLPPRLVNLTLEASLFLDRSTESVAGISVSAGRFRPPRA